MKEPFKKIESDTTTIWITQPSEVDTLLRREEIAFNVAKGKLIDSNGKLETIIQTGEAFGRGLFAEYIRKNTKKWNMEQLIEPVIENIFNPMGAEATFIKITEHELKSEISKFKILEKTRESDIAYLFIYGFARGIFRSAFPNGEVIMNTSQDESYSVELFFKANANDEDLKERERIKKLFIDKIKSEV